jgi:hypothetical protein
VSTTCELFDRIVPDERIADSGVIQEHHLRLEERAESPTVLLCRPCHDQVHATFTNEALWEHHDSIEALRAELADYIEWIDGTDALDIQVDSSNRE